MAIIFSKSNPSATGSITFTGSGAGGMTGGNAPPSGPVITTTINGGMYFDLPLMGLAARAGSESGASSAILNTWGGYSGDWFAGVGGVPPKWYTNASLAGSLPNFGFTGDYCVVGNPSMNMGNYDTPVVATFSTSTGDPVLFVSANSNAGGSSAINESYSSGDTITTLTFLAGGIDSSVQVQVTVGGTPYIIFFYGPE